MSSWPNTVTIGDFVADVNAPTGDFRVTAKVTGWGSAPVRLTMDDKSQQDGAWDATPVRSGRLITVEGVADQASPAAAQAVADALCGLPLRRLLDFTVTNEVIGARGTRVRVAAAVEPDWISMQSFSYSLQLWAPDPLKYGPLWFGSASLVGSVAGTGRVWPRAWPRDWGVAPGITPGAVAVPNAGTAPYWPSLRINGPVTNPVVTCQETGDSIRLNMTIPAGQFVVIDCGGRRVMYGPNADDARVVADAFGAWLVVPVGGATLSYTADTANAAATLDVTAYEGAWS